MAHTTKPFSEYDQNQIFKKSYNENGTVGVDGFIAGRVGNKITQTVSTTTAPNDTLTFVYTDIDGPLMTLVVIYTDNTYNTLISVQRTA